MSAYIALADGRVVAGQSRAPGTGRGELVFTTAYTGYEESLTDPSYAEQVLTFSYPLIGNYGVREERFESDSVQPRVAIAREFTDDVADWLTEAGVPAVDGVDTRDIVTAVREEGAMRCGVAAGPDATPEQARDQLAQAVEMSDHVDIGASVSVSEPAHYPGTGPCVALIDCGAKKSIIDTLSARGADVHVLPYDTTPETVADVEPDVVFVSNGPGDPANFTAAGEVAEQFAGETPLAGICLGQQVVARALGGETEKMEFGHRGLNQPVRDLETDRVVMTTQNHGYSVADPGDLAVTQVNVNDGTAEGLAGVDIDCITRQYHPEANPGPHDSLSFFDDVLAMATGTDTPPVSAD
ncbi:carbamoyl-phosphate synthase, small subunit [halophilic archaeon DL31]|jgi:carbamoyl-phosphate synthase small subunit|nr:carbamoyl-phosphate synthase, small subunit [halophilic archaeon DL31]